MTTTKRIVQVKFIRDTDTDADLSYLGEYSNQPGDDDKTIDREERGDCGRGEYRYFVAAMSGDETGNPESVEQDYQRMEDYNRCGWCMTYCYAVAWVKINDVSQKIRSGGLGGVESDSDRSYFDEIKREQFAELESILVELGFTADELAEAFDDAEDE